MPDTVFCLMGPTASGKTALACELLQQHPFEIVSVDSAMIYREMDIGTAKPSAEELKVAPHHLINLINPDESYSAAQFCADAEALCETIIARGHIPLLVGGTMMYFNAWQKGLSSLPEADESVRKQLDQELQRKGLDSLYEELTQVDPETAARIHAHDSQRIQRALEIYRLTGKPMSAVFGEEKKKTRYQCVNLILFPERRTWLHQRIALRFEQMLEQGLMEEVKNLQNKWQLNGNMPSMRSVGYRQVLEYLSGGYDINSLKEKGTAATRQLAKRQLTWLRQWENGVYFDPEDAHLHQKVLEVISSCMSLRPSK